MDPATAIPRHHPWHPSNRSWVYDDPDIQAGAVDFYARLDALLAQLQTPEPTT